MSVVATIIEQSFFARPALTVAKELLGKYLVRRVGKRKIIAPINEVEAYIGPRDLACHGRFGRTLRTEVMFGPGGRWYVYLCYGIHWMLNVVTDEPGHPAAVLLRGAGKFNGPGKLTKGLRIDRRLNATEIAESTGLWIEDHGIVVRKSQIERTPRIGVDYAGPWKDKLYRFTMKSPIRQ
ncbi:MAG: DNA-3-methyladenine glycosylase [Pirellulales bacterium]|nr:DNA-3-methyladenine glycosylase [Pirellulales bacterium]